MERFRFREFLRPEWGTGWSTSGSLAPAHDDHLTKSSLLEPGDQQSRDSLRGTEVDDRRHARGRDQDVGRTPKVEVGDASSGDRSKNTFEALEERLRYGGPMNPALQREP